MDMSFYKLGLAGVTSVAGAVSAFLWVMSARAEAPAKPHTVGVGALIGGDIVIKNNEGTRIDLIDTMAMQSRWNRRAAIFAAVAAGAQVLSVAPL